MIDEKGLKELAAAEAPDRAFLSIYLEGPRSTKELESKIAELARALRKGDGEKDEREHLQENWDAVERHLKSNPFTEGSLCLFSCWLTDFFRAVPLRRKVADLVVVDSSPYIRPLAELLDEYENAAVVIADNKRARVHLMSATREACEEVIKGNVKNHVRKGGWSQQRYERRRDKQLLSYAKEVVDALVQLDQQEDFRRIILAGGKEILQAILEQLPQALAAKAATKAVDLGGGDAVVNEEILAVLEEQERRSEGELWERIRAEYLRDGLAVVGVDRVLAAAREGRAAKLIVDRELELAGSRCRACEELHTSKVETCAACGSDSVFGVNVVEEIVEIAQRSGAAVDFADPIPTLAEVGGIAALTRY